jgi:hypothetical protein
MRMRVPALGLTGLALVAAGCLGSSASAPPGSSKRSPGPTVVVAHTSTVAAVSGGTAAERLLLRRVIARSGVSAVVAAQLGGPSGGFHQPGLWLRLTFAVPSPNKKQAVEPWWQAQLIEGAFRAARVQRGLPDLAGVMFRARFPTGRTRLWGAGEAGGNAPTRSSPSTATSETAITAHLVSAARAAGWKLRRVTLFRSDGFAAEATFVADRPHGFGKELSAFDAHLNLHGLAGTLIQVQNPCGRSVYLEAQARWVGISSGSADPRWLCPNPGVSLPTPCPPPATRPC